MSVTNDAIFLRIYSQLRVYVLLNLRDDMLAWCMHAMALQCI